MIIKNHSLLELTAVFLLPTIASAAELDTARPGSNIVDDGPVVGVFKKLEDGSKEPVSEAERLYFPRKQVASAATYGTSFNEASESILPEIEQKSLRKVVAHVSRSEHTRFSGPAWDVFVSPDRSHGWGRLRRGPENRLSASEVYGPVLSDAQLEEIAVETLKHRLGFLRTESQDGFGIEVEGIGESGVSIDSDEEPYGDSMSRSVTLTKLVRIRRTFDGVSFLGPGSFIMLEFDMGSELVSFSYDWTPLSPRGVVDDVSDVSRRVRSLNKQLEDADTSYDGVSSVQNDCGYFDPGFFGRNSEGGFLQVACAVARERSSLDVGYSAQGSGTARDLFLVSATEPRLDFEHSARQTSGRDEADGY